MEIMITAGEASGDAHAAELVRELRRRHPDLTFFGCGGDAMAASGCELLVSLRELAVMGLAEVLAHLPRLYGCLLRLRRALLNRRPAAVILVDFPDFNLRLAKAAASARVPAVYFISPQLWAWRERRVRLIRRYVQRMICIFPFEPEFYSRHGIAAAGVGHPLVERIAAARPALPSPDAFRRQLGIHPGAELVALLPGSRRREVTFHLDTLLETAELLRAEREIEFVLPLAPGIVREAVRAAIPPRLAPAVHLVDADQMYAAVAASRLALVASGTATVETALLGTPLIVFYRLSGLSYWLGRRLVRLPHIAMVNLIAGKAAVPELLQHEFEAGRLADAVLRLLPEGEARRQMLADLSVVQSRLGGPGAIARAADEVEAVLNLSGANSAALRPAPPGTPEARPASM